MRNKQRIKTKQGAASFYIVSISTLILTILALSFAAVIISEVNRTLNNDLSNSAYDSALAGIEDAKVAYLNYQSCINQGATVNGYNLGDSNLTCSDIIYLMEHPDCDMVGRILQRIGETESREVLIQETQNGDNEMAQAYTCVKIQTTLDDYRTVLTPENASQLIPLSLNTASASNVKSIRISWYSDNNGTTYNFGNRTSFGKALSTQLATPPTVAVQLIQTSQTFYMSQLDKTVGTQTDRGTLYFVATNTKNSSHKYDDSNIVNARFYDITSDNTIKSGDKQNFSTANNKTAKNVPNLVYCPQDSGNEFACSVSIELPEPVGGNRSSDTFMLMVSLPYGGPDTEFSIEACVGTSECDTYSYSSGMSSSKTSFRGGQISIDSTGRANNLYRRVMARLNSTDIYYANPFYAIQLTGGTDSDLLKEVETTKEYGL